MTDHTRSIQVWSPTDVVTIPAGADSPDQIVEYAQATLSKRDIHSIVAGFKAEGYEMVSTFVWAKAAAAMKRQLATLGMEFVGEMLGRPDLDDDSDPTTSIADHEVITLAEDLGMITATQALRLKHAQQLVAHFASLEDAVDDDDDSMQKEEAVSLLRTCVTSILGKEQFDAAVSFAAFRKRLTEETLQGDDEDVMAIVTSAYFFVRTTLSVLLSIVKTEKGAPLENAVGNTMLLLPRLWERLRETEKWQVGQAYAEVNAAGRRQASAGLKKALVDVKGFDFVPETLRSGTFTEAAAKVLSAHFALNNFYNEMAPMQVLANLGSTIPMPAFPKCMEATLAVYLGNRWGHAWNSQEAAEKVLKRLRATQWEYYFNECLWRDRTVLDKLSFEEKPVTRWRSLIDQYVPTEDITIRTKTIKAFWDASLKQNGEQAVKQQAGVLRHELQE
jgi:hypothetical protein